MNYLMLVGVVVIGLLGAVVVWQQDRIEVLNRDNGVLQGNVQSVKNEVDALNKTVLLMEKLQDEMQAASRKLEAENNGLVKERNEVNARLNSWRNRLHKEALARPAVVERAARAAINRRLRAFTKASRHGEQAGSDPGVPPAPAR